MDYSRLKLRIVGLKPSVDLYPIISNVGSPIPRNPRKSRMRQNREVTEKLVESDQNQFSTFVSISTLNRALSAYDGVPVSTPDRTETALIIFM